MNKDLKKDKSTLLTDLANSFIFTKAVKIKRWKIKNIEERVTRKETCASSFLVASFLQL